jgi:hypothetical protein
MSALALGRAPRQRRPGHQPRRTGHQPRRPGAPAAARRPVLGAAPGRGDRRCHRLDRAAAAAAGGARTCSRQAAPRCASATARSLSAPGGLAVTVLSVAAVSHAYGDGADQGPGAARRLAARRRRRGGLRGRAVRLGEDGAVPPRRRLRGADERHGDRRRHAVDGAGRLGRGRGAAAAARAARRAERPGRTSRCRAAGRPRQPAHRWRAAGLQQLLEDLDLAELADRAVYETSLGEQQRAAAGASAGAVPPAGCAGRADGPPGRRPRRAGARRGAAVDGAGTGSWSRATTTGCSRLPTASCAWTAAACCDDLAEGEAESLSRARSARRRGRR